MTMRRINTLASRAVTGVPLTADELRELGHAIIARPPSTRDLLTMYEETRELYNRADNDIVKQSYLLQLHEIAMSLAIRNTREVSVMDDMPDATTVAKHDNMVARITKDNTR